MEITIPGALADHLASTNLATGPASVDPAAPAARAALDAGRRGRGRTLVITPRSTAVLQFISAFAEAILINRTLHTAAEARAARAWLNRAGRATATLAADLAAERRRAAAEVALAKTVEEDDTEHAAEQASSEGRAAGTWRDEWIGEQAGDDTLFAIEPAAEQGALFAPGPRVVCADGRERTVEDTVERTGEPARVVVEGGTEWIADNRRPVREQQRAALARIKAKADADRAAYQAATDDQIAAECAAHGVPAPHTVTARIAARTKQTPARRLIEGVVVTHVGTAKGSTPADADHPNVMAARSALDGLAAATMTDHHDVTEPTEDEQHVRGYLIDPREGDRVAVYWLEGGRVIRRDQMPHGPALDCLADRLHRRGWKIEPMLRISQCVFAHRPAK
ncbi:hypothetical protein [Streptomyces sp. NPDC018045]|uniref:hypothetical protein n=1 Tax=Streptomyces sp. NPDC018045 TaxID=3365037 RepID=UPI00379B7B37